MSLTVELPGDVQRRLETEAARRGITVDEVIAALAAGLPTETATERPHRLGFIGIGASGDTRPFDIHRERGELAHRQLTDDL